MSQVKLKDMMDAALTQTGEESSMLLGQQLTIDESDSVTTNKITYFSDSDDAIFVANVEAREEYSGQFYMIFSLRDAILLSGLLLGIPPARVNEKRRLAIMEPDDIDAFGEIMNQIIGSFNSVLKPSLPKKIHLKLNSPKKFIPGVDEMSDEEPIPTGEYVLFRAQLNMEGLEMDRLNILMPVELAHQIEPPAAEPEPVAADAGAAAAGAETASAPAAGAVPEAEAIILLLEDDEQVRENVRQSLCAAGMNVVAASLKADIREICAQNNARVAVVGVADTEDRELALCIKINAMNQDAPLPIIMCAPQWTRSGVLKALKYGARDIVLKPYDADELVTKVNRFLKAA
ncbi:response regulator PleD [Geobacter sp. OR-1]|uniref:response regulator n=1 Tax=Geobacter sp. OR-1 TaxID=1266765 RepID=UPI000543017D|nr:response regulator [Geobacter sp. OR-1]GAM09704.1 response regulator PleD [Geobacter sp. OR-1]